MRRLNRTGNWRKYARVFTLGLQSQMEYRANYVFETIIGMVTFVVLFFLWRSVYDANHDLPIAGLAFKEMLTYVLLAKFWDWVIDPTAEIDNQLPDDIRNGGLNKYLIRPINDRSYRFSLYLANKVMNAVLRLGPVALVILIFPGAFTLSPNVGWWYLPLAGFLALTLQFSFSYLVAMIAFWWLEIWGVLFLKRLIVSFLAGAWLPLSVFPAEFVRIFLVLPFQYMIFFPIQILLGKLPPAAIQTGMSVQILWIFAFTLAGKLLWSFGMKQYSAAGI